jgi:hypothetical protein
VCVCACVRKHEHPLIHDNTTAKIYCRGARCVPGVIETERRACRSTKIGTRDSSHSFLACICFCATGLVERLLLVGTSTWLTVAVSRCCHTSLHSPCLRGLPMTTSLFPGLDSHPRGTPGGSGSPILSSGCCLICCSHFLPSKKNSGRLSWPSAISSHLALMFLACRLLCSQCVREPHCAHRTKSPTCQCWASFWIALP